MTDGIIQKAFDNVIIDMLNAQIPSYTINRVIQLKQELIEEIKKELSDRNYEDYIDKPIIEELKRIITGDNKE